jgi:hypothetical protein
MLNYNEMVFNRFTHLMWTIDNKFDSSEKDGYSFTLKLWHNKGMMQNHREKYKRSLRN